MFSEDIIPECRCSVHPSHTDKRKWMRVVKEEAEYVVWCCERCTEISHIPTVQVQMLPRGWQRARWANRIKEREKQQLLSQTRAGSLRLTEGS